MECGPPRGSPEPTVSWRKNGQTLDLNSSKRIRLVDGGNLAIQEARQGDDGRYQCIVRNAAGTRESAVAFLKVHGKCESIENMIPVDGRSNSNRNCYLFFFVRNTVKPFLIRGPQNQTSVVGSSVTFQCRVGGEPLPDVLWRRTASGGNMPLGKCNLCVCLCATNHPVIPDRVKVLRN